MKEKEAKEKEAKEKEIKKISNTGGFKSNLSKIPNKKITVESKTKQEIISEKEREKIKSAEPVSNQNTFFEVPSDKKREFNEDDLDKYDDDYENNFYEKQTEKKLITENENEAEAEAENERKKKVERLPDNINLAETNSGGFFKTSMTTASNLQKMKEREFDTNLIEEGGSDVEADLSKEIAKIEESLYKKTN